MFCFHFASFFLFLSLLHAAKLAGQSRDEILVHELSNGSSCQCDLWKLRKPRQLSEVKSVTYGKNQLGESFPMVPRSCKYMSVHVGVLIADSDFPMS